MKINAQTSPTNVDTWEGLRRFTTTTLDDILRAINGEIDFVDNCSTKLATFEIVDPAKIGQDVVISHGLNRMPNGYVLVGASEKVTIYNGNTPSTIANIYFRGSGVGIYKVLIFYGNKCVWF